MTAPSSVIVGLGNPVRSDDGVGLRVIEHIEAAGAPDGVDLVAAGTPGLGILDLIAGYRRAVIVDAIDIGADPGTVHHFELADVEKRAPTHTIASHGIDLTAALSLGRRLGLTLPEKIHIAAVQIEDATTLCERCTRAVEGAIAEAAALALDLASEEGVRL